MLMLAWISGAVVVLVWLVIVAGRGGFWRASRLVLTAEDCNQASSRVVAVVPARNEADTIRRSVGSLLTQRFNGTLQVVVVDDHSDDDTADIAARAAAELEKSDRLTVIPGAALPAGWTGKLWAVKQGVEAARRYAPDYLLLTDADIVHGPQTVAALTAKAEQGQLALTSLMVKLHCRTLPERFLIPAFVYFFFMLYPPSRIADRNSRVAGAAGGCMLVRPEKLDDAGGIEGIRNEIIDDCALAGAMKRAGGKLWLGLANESESVRRYDGFREIGQMIERTAFNQLGHSTMLLLGTVAGLLITFVLPVVLLFSTYSVGVAFGIGALALMFGSYLPMVRYYRLSPLWAATLPIGVCFYLWSTLRSALNYWGGKGGQWKGRAQDTK